MPMPVRAAAGSGRSRCRMPSASWRARQRPMANRRSRWRRSVSTGVANPSDAPAGMQRGDAEAEIAVLHIAEAGRTDHRREALRRDRRRTSYELAARIDAFLAPDTAEIGRAHV